MSFAIPTAQGVLRVLEREFTVWRRLWRASAFSSFASPVLFLGALGVGLGALVHQGSGDFGGVDYLAFVTPGLLAASAMQSAATASLYTVMAGTTWLRTYHVMVTAPLSASDVYVGVVSWTALRAGMAATVFLAVAWALGGVLSFWALLAVPAAVLTAAAFAAPLAAWASTRSDDSSFTVILRLLIQPLFLFSGTFFPVDRLPQPARPLVFLSPLWHGVELCRAATTGRIQDFGVLGHLAVLGFLVVACAVVGMRVFAARLEQ